MIRLHHLEYSRSTRVLWLLEELDLQYELKTYPRDPKTIRAPKSLRELHPLGRSPLLEIDGRVLAESGAILTYLTEREGRLGAPDGDARHEYHYWLHYAEGSAVSPLLVKLITTSVRKAPLPFLIKPIAKGVADKIDANFTNQEMSAHFGWIEQALSERDYFAGDEFSAADIQMSYPVQGSFVRGEDLPERPATRAWLSRVEARAAYHKALEKGGPTMMPPQSRTKS